MIGLQKLSYVLYDSIEQTKRQTKSIENENSISFDLSLDSDFTLYDVVLLADAPTKPLYHGSLYSSSSDTVIVDISKIHISSVSFASGSLTFGFDATYSGSFVISFTKRV